MAFWSHFVHRGRVPTILCCCFLMMTGYASAQSSFDSIRLVSGSVPSEGRVEVYRDGQWGTICDDGWDIDDADVVCRQVGYSRGALSATQGGYFKSGSGPIFLNNVICYGWESSLSECLYFDWETWDCCHSEEAGVVCNDGLSAGSIAGICVAIVFVVTTAGVIVAIVLVVKRQRASTQTATDRDTDQLTNAQIDPHQDVIVNQQAPQPVQSLHYSMTVGNTNRLRNVMTVQTVPSHVLPQSYYPMPAAPNNPQNPPQMAPTHQYNAGVPHGPSNVAYLGNPTYKTTPPSPPAPPDQTNKDGAPTA